MASLQGNAVIGQSGGPTAVINQSLVGVIQEAKKAGRSVEEAAKGWTMPAKYAGYAAPQAARVQANFQVIYNETK